MWNFKGKLWNSTQNILPMYWKRWYFIQYCKSRSSSDLQARKRFWNTPLAHSYRESVWKNREWIYTIPLTAANCLGDSSYNWLKVLFSYSFRYCLCAEKPLSEPMIMALFINEYRTYRYGSLCPDKLWNVDTEPKTPTNQTAGCI